MCTASLKYSGSFIKSLILNWKLHPICWVRHKHCLYVLQELPHSFSLQLNLAQAHIPHTHLWALLRSISGVSERGWVSRRTAAASQIWAQDGNSAPTWVQLTEIQRSSRGVWKALVEHKGAALSIQGGQAQSNLSAVLADRPGANLLYSLPFHDLCCWSGPWFLNLWAWASNHQHTDPELVRQIHPLFFVYPK